MKLKQFIKDLLQFASDNPDSLEFDVIYASDDERYYFHKIYNTPTLGTFEHNDFHTFEDDYEPGDGNAVCIN